MVDLIADLLLELEKDQKGIVEKIFSVHKYEAAIKEFLNTKENCSAD